jgi:hypothetical protein
MNMANKAKSMTRADCARLIAESSRKPLPKISPIVKVECSDGQWRRATGIPNGVTTTGNRKIVGYAYRSTDGSTYGTMADTDAELIERHTNAQNKAVADFYDILISGSDKCLREQWAFWMHVEFPTLED